MYLTSHDSAPQQTAPCVTAVASGLRLSATELVHVALTAAVSSGGIVTLQIGSVIGTGGVPTYNAIDTNGVNRINSAQATVVAEPSAILLLGFAALSLVSTRRYR